MLLEIENFCVNDLLTLNALCCHSKSEMSVSAWCTTFIEI